MSPFENIIEDAAARFGLGAKAGQLVRELLALMTNTPGGISGFLDKFRSAGLSREVTGWLGNGSAPALSGSQVEQALGSDAVRSIAQKVGINTNVASQAIGYLAPKVIGQLTPNGMVTPNVPRSVSDFLRSTGQAAGRLPDQVLPDPATVSQASGGIGRWLAPLLALLALAGALWHFLANRPETTPSPSASVPGTTAPLSATPSRLAISNDNGVVTVSGTVRDEASRSSIMDMMRGVFGSTAVKGDVAVDPKAAATPWLGNLRPALEQMKTPGMHAVFSGDSLDLGGNISDADRERALNSLRTMLKQTGINVSGMDNISNMVSDSTNRALAALASLGSGFRAPQLLDVLNKSIINFPTGSAEIPPISRTLLQQAAAKFKELPAGTVIQIGGYTDNTGDQAANVQLSQQRAEAVRNLLVQSGVSPDTLVAKGFGSASPIASNDTPDGRFQNRRIEYQVKP